MTAFASDPRDLQEFPVRETYLASPDQPSAKPDQEFEVTASTALTILGFDALKDQAVVKLTFKHADFMAILPELWERGFGTLTFGNAVKPVPAESLPVRPEPDLSQDLFVPQVEESAAPRQHKKHEYGTSPESRTRVRELVREQYIEGSQRPTLTLIAALFLGTTDTKNYSFFWRKYRATVQDEMAKIEAERSSQMAYIDEDSDDLNASAPAVFESRFVRNGPFQK